MQITTEDVSPLPLPPSGDPLGRLAVACEQWVRLGNSGPIARWLGEQLAPDGTPLRLAVEDWGRAFDRIEGAISGRPGLPPEVEARTLDFFSWLVHFTRPDASPIFGPIGRRKPEVARLGIGARLERAALRSAEVRAEGGEEDEDLDLRPRYATVATRWGATSAGDDDGPPPLPARRSEARPLAILRPDWNPRGDSIAVDARSTGVGDRIELSGVGRPWLRGTWGIDGPPGVVAGGSKGTAWSTGAEADAFEWSFRVGPARITRTAVLLRYRSVALLAQGQEGGSVPIGSRIELGDGTLATPIADSRGWTLSRGPARARLAPIGLPARLGATAHGTAEVEGGSVSLRSQPDPARPFPRRSWLPLLLCWGRGPTSWRTLTVTEKSTICGPEVAFAARAGWGLGRDSLLFYRSLARPALRVVLGHQTRARFLVARFTPEGDVIPLLSLA